MWQFPARRLPVQANQWHSMDTEHLWTSDRPQKQATAKADLSTLGSGVLVIS